MEEIVEGLNRNQQNVLALQQNHKLSSWMRRIFKEVWDFGYHCLN